MNSAALASQPAARAEKLPASLGRRFEALVFDWDGTAVPRRAAGATVVTRLVEESCALGLHAAVVSRANVQNIDGQLAARPRGPGSLYLLLDRGSEVFHVGPNGPRLLHRRRATGAAQSTDGQSQPGSSVGRSSRGAGARAYGPEPAWRKLERPMKQVVVGFVGSDADAPPVLLATLEASRLFGLGAEAVQVRSRTRSARSCATARELGVPLRVLESAPASGLIAEAAREEVACLVIGARRRPFTSRGELDAVFVELATSARKPLFVLPPGARIGPIRRLLAPLDGSPEVARSVRRALKRVASADIETVVVHVCPCDEAPPFSDHALYETEAWGSEFLARNCPHGRLELRVGSAEDLILDVADTSAADLIVLGWGQLLARGQGRVVRHVLEGAGIPVLLLSARRVTSYARSYRASALSEA
jgi:nucleotide-binding universal stress UspA family protein